MRLSTAQDRRATPGELLVKRRSFRVLPNVINFFFANDTDLFVEATLRIFIWYFLTLAGFTSTVPQASSLQHKQRVQEVKTVSFCASLLFSHSSKQPGIRSHLKVLYINQMKSKVVVNSPLIFLNVPISVPEDWILVVMTCCCWPKHLPSINQVV